MITPTANPTCVLFALKRERRTFHHHFPITRRLTNAPCWSALCSENLLVLQTGVGPDRMQSAMNWLLEIGKPRLVLSAGYAGALCDDLQVGDTFLAGEVVDQNGNLWSVPWPSETTVHSRARLLTMPHFVATPEDKRALATRHRARIVDMESAVVARECTNHGVAFGCLRTISDAVEPALSPQIVKLLANGRVPIARLSWAILRAPKLVPELLRLARQTRLASHRLGLALRDLLTPTARDHERGTERHDRA